MPKPEPRPLRTLPERAFRARARLVAALMCCVCFAGLAARLAYLQLFSGDWYTNRALGQQLRDTVVPADRGRIYSADGVLLAANSSCWTLRASPREMPEEKLSLAAQGLAEILELDEAKLLEKFSDRTSNDCLLRYRVERDTADAAEDAQSMDSAESVAPAETAESTAAESAPASVPPVLMRARAALPMATPETAAAPDETDAAETAPPKRTETSDAS